MRTIIYYLTKFLLLTACVLIRSPQNDDNGGARVVRAVLESVPPIVSEICQVRAYVNRRYDNLCMTFGYFD